MKKRIVIALIVILSAGAAWWLLARATFGEGHDKGEAAARTADGFSVVVSVDASYGRPLLARLHERKKDKGDSGKDTITEEIAQAVSFAVAKFRLEDLFKGDGKAFQSAVSGAVSAALEKHHCVPDKVPVVGARMAPGEFGRYVAAHSRKSGRKIIVLGMDGLDWKIIDALMAQGRMPNIKRMIEEGASGNLRSIEPILSPLIWTTMATGKLPEKHGVTDFIAVSDKGQVIPINSTYRKVPALWQMLGWAGLKPAFAGWLATWPADQFDGFMVTERAAQAAEKPGASDAGLAWPPALYDEMLPVIKDSEKAAGAAEGGLINSGFAGAGDVIASFEKRTRRISSLKEGVGNFLSMQEVGLKLLKDKKPDLLAVYFAGSDTTSHEFLEFAAPERDSVDEKEYEAFKDVVDRMYELVDKAVGMYLAAAGDEYDVIVISDHGFKSGALRPKESGAIEGKAAALWHRLMGVIIARGPDIARGREITQASVKDIAPTLLYALGLPVGGDMDGEVISRLFSDEFNKERGAPARIASYDWGRQPLRIDAAAMARGAAGDKESLDKLKQLGYVGGKAGAQAAPAGGPAAAGKSSSGKDRMNPDAREYANLGSRDLQEKRYQSAVENYKKALGYQPSSPLLLLGLADAYAKGGDRDNAWKALREAMAHADNTPSFHANLGALLMIMERYQEAENELKSAVALDPGMTEAYDNLGLIAYRAHRLNDAIEYYKKALNLEPDSSLTRLNLGIAYWDSRDFKNTAAELEKAFALNRDYESKARLLLAAGISHYENGDYARAGARLGQALALRPNMPQAHYYLGLVAEKQGNSAAARSHFQAEVRVSPNDNRAREHLGTPR